MMDTSKTTPSLFTVQYSHEVMIADLNFSMNWLDSGAISVFTMKEYLDHYDWYNCVVRKI